MKLKVVVVDLELSRRQRRILAGVIATTAIGVSVAFAAVPRTFTAGEVLKASDLNANFADVDERITAVDQRVTSVETRSVTVLEASSDTVENGSGNNQPLVYSAATLTLTPGKWSVTASATVFTTTNPDTVALSLFDQTAATDIPASIGGLNSSTAVNALFPVSTAKVLTITAPTEIRMKLRPNGASTVHFGTPAASPLTGGQMRLSAVRLSD